MPAVITSANEKHHVGWGKPIYRVAALTLFKRVKHGGCLSRAPQTTPLTKHRTDAKSGERTCVTSKAEGVNPSFFYVAAHGSHHMLGVVTSIIQTISTVKPTRYIGNTIRSPLQMPSVGA